MLDNPSVIYCYTGTGNSLEVAKTIASVLDNPRIISMSSDPKKVSSINSEVIGFVFPVHHWNMPKRVREFVSSVQINPRGYIFAIAACGGIAVNTLIDFNRLITDKGAHLAYSTVHKNVSCYIVAYNPFPDPQKQLPKSKKTLSILVEDIRQRSHKKAPPSHPIKQLQRVIMQGAAKRFPDMDRHYHVSDACKGCGTCAGICPAKNIHIENQKPVFQHRCEQCMACIQYCPQRAINYKLKTQKRERYHHPNVTAQELVKFHNNEL